MLDWIKGFVAEPQFARQIEFLSKVPIFAGLPRKGLEILRQSLSVRDYHKGEALCELGQVGHFLFLIESGAVAVMQKDAAGQVSRVAALGAGDFFGEMSVLDGRPRTATVIALEPVKVYLLYRSEIDRLISEDPSVGAVIVMRIAQLVAARLRAELEKRGAAS